ncbi:MAG TPA: hypothetical protein VKL22_06885 [Actinomycetota bacterium]|nr:hypothetical protein [Actinomycetota bacterium]
MPLHGWSSSDGVATGLAGALYLVNVLVWLELPRYWVDRRLPEDHHPSGWAILELLARRLVPDGAPVEVDALWGLLTELDGRSPERSSPASGSAERAAAEPGELRLPASWLRRWCPPPRRWSWHVAGDRVVIEDEAPSGFVVANLPTQGSAVATSAAEARRLEGEEIHGTLKAEPTSRTDAPLWPDMVAGFVRWLLGSRGIGPVALAVPGRVSVTRTHVDVVFSLERVDIAVRRSGLDVDPGWVPDLGRIVSFHYL